MGKESYLRNSCIVNTGEDGNRFVGIKADSQGVKVHFPLGYHLSQNDCDLRRDIIQLIRVLLEFNKVDRGTLSLGKSNNVRQVELPIAAYLEIINNYFENGYYREKVYRFKTGGHGNIDWTRTIKDQKVIIQSNHSPIYSEYTVRQSRTSIDKEITKINVYCVQESFKKIGWLFTASIPMSQNCLINRQRAIFLVRQKLECTNNDAEKRLFKSMLDMLNYLDNSYNEGYFYFGTDSFEYIWERLVNQAFGIKDKKEYFPRTKWFIKSNGQWQIKSPLEPDSVMSFNGKIYILDSKYYRYGLSANPNHLPDSSSINKQITYGEYVFTEKEVPNEKLFNAFLMPYNSVNNSFGISGPFGNIGTAIADWKGGLLNYERIQGIVIDMRYLMYHYRRIPEEDIAALARIIEEGLMD